MPVSKREKFKLGHYPNLGYSFYSFRNCLYFPLKRYHWYQSEAGSGGIGPSAVTQFTL
jgi:hypothetical protein